MGINKLIKCQRSRRRSHSPSTSLPEVFPPPSPRLSSPPLRELSSSFRSNMPTQISPRNNNTPVLVTASQESSPSRVCSLSGEVTWPTSSVISQPRPSTSPARIPTRSTSAHTTPRLSQSSSSWVTWPPVVLPVLPPSASSTHSISQEPDLLPMSVQLMERENSTVLLIASRRSSPRTASPDFTKVSESPSSVSSSTEPPTSVSSILVRLCSVRSHT